MTRKFVLELALALAAGITFTYSAQAQSPARPAEIAPIYKVAAKTSDSTPGVPGTLATNASRAPKAKLQNPFSVRVEPDSLPSWVTNQPLAYMQYGAAPAVVTLHFGRKDKAEKD